MRWKRCACATILTTVLLMMLSMTKFNHPRQYKRRIGEGPLTGPLGELRLRDVRRIPKHCRIRCQCWRQVLWSLFKKKQRESNLLKIQLLPSPGGNRLLPSSRTFPAVQRPLWLVAHPPLHPLHPRIHCFFQVSSRALTHSGGLSVVESGSFSSSLSSATAASSSSSPAAGTGSTCQGDCST